MIRLLHEARRRLKNGRRSAAVTGAARLIVFLICLLAAVFLRKMLTEAGAMPAETLSAETGTGDLFLCAALLLALLARTPLRMQCDWQIGRLAGTLDENDLGFLAQSTSIWLWGKAIFTQMLFFLLTVLSALPALLLYVAAKSIWLTIPPETESLLPLLTVVHLGILCIAAAFLPLRTTAAGSALPFCFLKMPHELPLRILQQCFRLTRGRSFSILAMRILLLPALVFPLTAVEALPVLLTAEQIRCEQALRHARPRRSSRFHRLELHAYDAPASA